MSRGGVQGFQCDRLSQMLAARRLTQAQLASLVGVSPATVSKWRAGTQAPEREALDRLAGVVNVTPEWFTRPPAEKVSLPLFRSNASAHVAARAMLEARMEWAQDIALAFTEFVDVPALNLPSRNFTDPEQITHEEIELAAAECRDLWRLGRSAVQDLALAVEGAGVVLIREETGIAQIEGLSAWSAVLGRPLVLLSADKDNGYRSRFDLAHELGAKAPHLVKKDDLLLMKRRWGVSVGAILMRLRALKLLDDEGAQALFKRRSARWGAKSEPGDGDRAPERPRLLRRTIDLLVDENVMPLEAIPRHLGLASHDIEMLAGLPEGYFQGRGNVVQLARIRQSADAPASSASAPSTVLPFRDPRRS